MVLYDAETAQTLDYAPDGILRHLHTGEYTFETGGVLPDVVLGFETWGTLNEDASNAVYIAHALPGIRTLHAALNGARLVGDGFVGPGKTVDMDRFSSRPTWSAAAREGPVRPAWIRTAIRGARVSPSPPSRIPCASRHAWLMPWESRSAYGPWRFHGRRAGAGMGCRVPERVRNCVVVAATAESSAEQIAFAQAQSAAIRLDPDFGGGDDYANENIPSAGLGLARRIAHITYRAEPELAVRFGRAAQDGEDPVGSANLNRGRYQVESYLDHQAGKPRAASMPTATWYSPTP